MDSDPDPETETGAVGNNWRNRILPYLVMTPTHPVGFGRPLKGYTFADVGRESDSSGSDSDSSGSTRPPSSNSDSDADADSDATVKPDPPSILHDLAPAPSPAPSRKTSRSNRR